MRLGQWDSEAGVWVAESDDVPGLVAEADSPNVLAQKLKTLIPELLELNGVASDRTARFHVRYQHEDWRSSSKAAVSQRRDRADNRFTEFESQLEQILAA